MQPPFYRITMDVLEAAKDAGDEAVIAACRRTIVAFRRGFKRHQRAEDTALIYAFAA